MIYFRRTEEQLEVEVGRDQGEEEDTEAQPRPQPRLTLASGPIKGEYCPASTNESSPGPGREVEGPGVGGGADDGRYDQAAAPHEGVVNVERGGVAGELVPQRPHHLPANQR